MAHFLVFLTIETVRQYSTVNVCNRRRIPLTVYCTMKELATTYSTMQKNTVPFHSSAPTKLFVAQ